MIIPNSERLTFRLMDENDADLLWQLDQDPDVMRYITDGKTSSMDDIVSRFIPRLNSYRNVEQGWGLWQVSTIENHEYLGWILIRPMSFFDDAPELNNLEIGWRFFQHSWGKGYATEAATALKHTFSTQKSVSYLSALALADNTASIGIMRKLGMTLLKNIPYQGPEGEQPAVYYQIPLK